MNGFNLRDGEYIENNNNLRYIYRNIYDINKKRHYSINSKEGKQILNKYLIVAGEGGAGTQEETELQRLRRELAEKTRSQRWLLETTSADMGLALENLQKIVEGELGIELRDSATTQALTQTLLFKDSGGILTGDQHELKGKLRQGYVNFMKTTGYIKDTNIAIISSNFLDYLLEREDKLETCLSWTTADDDLTPQESDELDIRDESAVSLHDLSPNTTFNRSGDSVTVDAETTSPIRVTSVAETTFVNQQADHEAMRTQVEELVPSDAEATSPIRAPSDADIYGSNYPNRPPDNWTVEQLTSRVNMYTHIYTGTTYDTYPTLEEQRVEEYNADDEL